MLEKSCVMYADDFLLSSRTCSSEPAAQNLQLRAVGSEP